MAEFTPNFNLKKPMKDEFYNIEDFNGNMDIIDEALKNAGQSEQLESDVTEIKNDIGSPSDISSSPTIFGKLAEIKETLTTKFSEIISKITSIDSKIGTTTDTGGTSSAGGIFAKLNKLLTDWTTTRANRIDSIYTNTTTNNTASTTGTLSQKLSSIISTVSSILTTTNSIDSKVGATTDTGGTSSAGSAFAKLNKLLTDWTSTRASRIDTIYNNTLTSSTSSSTGTLSQKLNYLINQRQASLTGTGTTVYSSNAKINSDKQGYKCLAKFIAPVDGVYRVTIKCPVVSSTSSGDIYKIEDVKLGVGYLTTTYEDLAIHAYAISQSVSYEASTVGSESYVSGTNTWGKYISNDDRGGLLISAMPRVGQFSSSSSTAKTTSFNIYCKAGEPVQLVGHGFTSAGITSDSIVITYQKK